MEAEAELDRLYRRPLAEFIAARNELAKRLRQAGEREAADRVKALTKPSLTAWAVNQLHVHAPEELDRLTAAGDELRAAHLAGGEAHRTAMKARREAVSRLLALADGILQEGAHTLSRVHRQRISRTLEALASLGAGGGEAGRLSQDLEPPGFDALASLAAALPAAPRPPAAAQAEKPPPAAEKPRKTGPAVAEPVDLAAERQRRQELERVDRQLAAARSAVGEAETQVAGLEGEARDGRQRLAAAEDAASAASAAAEEAKRRVREARDAVAGARLESEAATAALERGGGELETARKKLDQLESERRRLTESDRSEER